MPKYVTIGYGDQAGYEKTPEDLRSASRKVPPVFSGPITLQIYSCALMRKTRDCRMKVPSSESPAFQSR